MSTLTAMAAEYDRLERARIEQGHAVRRAAVALMDTEPHTRIAAAAGVSVKTLYRWKNITRTEEAVNDLETVLDDMKAFKAESDARDQEAKRLTSG